VKRIVFEDGFPKEDGTIVNIKDKAYVVRGPKGAVVLMLGWIEPSARHLVTSLGVTPDGYYASDLGYHKATRGNGKRSRYRTFNRWCFATNGKCLYDGTSLGAISMYRLKMGAGIEAMWEALESSYEAL
jgi:hypothetical protein